MFTNLLELKVIRTILLFTPTLAVFYKMDELEKNNKIHILEITADNKKQVEILQHELETLKSQIINSNYKIQIGVDNTLNSLKDVNATVNSTASDVAVVKSVTIIGDLLTTALPVIGIGCIICLCVYAFTRGNADIQLLNESIGKQTENIIKNNELNAEIVNKSLEIVSKNIIEKVDLVGNNVIELQSQSLAEKMEVNTCNNIEPLKDVLDMLDKMY
jgi:hypothetical protein